MDANEKDVTTISGATTYDEIGAYWDSHSTADHWDEGHDVEVEFRLSAHHKIALEAELYSALAVIARRQGIAVETLVNLWLAQVLSGTKARVDSSAGGLAEQRGKYSVAVTDASLVIHAEPQPESDE